MSERLKQRMADLAREEYGGPVPDSVWSVAWRAGTEIRQAILKQDSTFDREKLYAIEMVAVDTALRVACQTLFERRQGNGEFETGFGAVSKWHANGRG